jgi:hypothetical protein
MSRIPESVEECVPALHQPGKDGVEFGQFVGYVGGETIPRTVGPDPIAGPDLRLAIPGADEQVEIAVRMARDQDADSIRLVESREVVEVRVLTEDMIHIVVAHRLGGGGDYCDRTIADRRHQPVAVVSETI